MPEQVEQPVDQTDAKGSGEKPDSPKEAQDPIKELNSRIEKDLKARIDQSKTQRRQFSNDWKRNVDLRLGRIGTTLTSSLQPIDDDVQTEINPDWSLTKAKTANLFSQVPTVQCTHENKAYAAAIPPFSKSINYELGDKRANIGASMEEVMSDVVNAAGVGFIVVDYIARFEDVQVPTIDTKMLPEKVVQFGMSAGLIPSKTVQRVVSDKFVTDRRSPTDLLYPADFTGSDFDKGDFVGYSDEMPWPDAMHELKLTEEQKQKALTSEDRHTEDDLRSSPDRGGKSTLNTERVRIDRIFYWRHRVDPDEKHLDAIWEMVFVKGLDEPAVHRPWRGQRLVTPKGQRPRYIGARKFPVRILTTTYITDNPIPPSDSQAGRPQVSDLRRSRSQLFANRKYSIPIRWFDVNRVDPLVRDNLMRGTYQGMIPTNGDGSRAIGEVARASYPSEDFAFDAATKADLMEIWQLGPDQLGGSAAGSRQNTAKVQSNQMNFATRIGQERTRVAKFFIGVVEVLAGLMSLYSDFPILTPQEKEIMTKTWDTQSVLHELVFKIRPDSTIQIDSQVRVERLFKFLNMTVKSGVVNPIPILVEIAELSDIDPSEVIIQPKPKGPEEPNISFRFSGKDDLQNLGVMAMLVKHGQAPTPEEMQKAKQILKAAQRMPDEPDEPAQAGPAGPAPERPAENHADWQLGDRIAKRSRDISGG